MAGTALEHGERNERQGGGGDVSRVPSHPGFVPIPSGQTGN